MQYPRLDSQAGYRGRGPRVRARTCLCGAALRLVGSSEAAVLLVGRASAYRVVNAAILRQYLLWDAHFIQIRGNVVHQALLHSKFGKVC